MIKQRILKFRVWDRVIEQFVNLSEYTHTKMLDKGESTYMTQGSLLSLDENGTLNFGNRLEFQQFTGLLDKNKKQIYEGDLIKFKYHESAMIGYDHHYKYRVVWHKDEASFVVADSSGGEYFNRFSDMYKIEVIGNVFENKS